MKKILLSVMLIFCGEVLSGTKSLPAELKELRGSLTQLKNKLEALNTKLGELKGKLGESPAIALVKQGPRSFKAIWCFRCFDSIYYNPAKECFNQMFKDLMVHGPAVAFDDQSKTITVGYSKEELLALCKLANKRDLFYIAHHYKNVFSDYMSALGLVASRPKSFTREVEQLNNDATIFFDKFILQGYKSNLSGITSGNFIKKILQNSQGFCLGEVHRDISPKKFLIENMGQLKKQGVTVIYLEHLLSDLHQEELNSFLLNENQKDLSKALEAYLQAMDAGHMWYKAESGYTYLKLVRAAKEHGIRIVAIDTEASYTTFHSGLGGGDSAQRFKNMNFLAYTKITSEEETKVRKGSKWILFAGSGHVATTDGVPGLANMLKVPSIVMQDSEADAITVQQNAKIENTVFDVLAKVNPQLPINLF